MRWRLCAALLGLLGLAGRCGALNVSVLSPSELEAAWEPGAGAVRVVLHGDVDGGRVLVESTANDGHARLSVPPPLPLPGLLYALAVGAQSSPPFSFSPQPGPPEEWGCPNACSGWGECDERGQCACFHGRTGGDCSLALCPLGVAHVASPLGDLDADGHLDSLVSGVRERYPGGAHGYVECSSRGLCDRSGAGRCDCFPGFEGSACQRTSCPRVAGDVCAGHGVCRSMAQLAGAQGHAYSLWDAHVTHGCQCDPGYSGVDCWDRDCPIGADPLYSAAGGHPVYSSFRLRAPPAGPGGEFRLRVFDQFGEDYISAPLWDGQCPALMRALWALPNAAVSPRARCYPLVPGLVEVVREGQAGPLRLPSPLYGPVTVLPGLLRGSNADRFTRLVPGRWSARKGFRVLTSRSVDADLAADVRGLPQLVRLGDQLLVLVTASRRRATALWPLGVRDADELSLLTAPSSPSSSSTRVSVSDVTVALAAGSSSPSFSSPSPALTPGVEIVIHNQLFVLRDDLQLDRPFAGHAVTGADVVGARVVVVGTSSSSSPSQLSGAGEGEGSQPPGAGEGEGEVYVGPCALRGKCNRLTGLCSCDFGFTGNACEERNGLAAPPPSEEASSAFPGPGVLPDSPEE